MATATSLIVTIMEARDAFRASETTKEAFRHLAVIQEAMNLLDDAKLEKLRDELREMKKAQNALRLNETNYEKAKRIVEEAKA
jgi:hypothetical protein